MQATDNNYQAYNNRLKQPANALRNASTKAEACLWKYALRAGQMKGYGFKRQRPVLNYIADFICQPLRLIIELDGGIHKEDEVAAQDLKRQRELEDAGFTVIRFRNDAVLQQMPEVRQQIELWIENYETQHGIPEKAAG